ncbi:protein HGH1 homolog isoform X2 [Ceratina calcarata]|uniref:Protein HGH1 homolog n=1 Tax=Ceratina calcarata TaxID=156304 RepID=A0AAJ7N6D6_9HYME|nr:protein HGH1 homolog isoform X2 [Ceratina calcarata]
MEALEQIHKYLNPDVKQPKLKILATEHLSGLTGTAEGRELLLKCPKVLTQLIVMIQDSDTMISKAALQALINITADEAGASACLLISEVQPKDEKYSSNLVQVCIRCIMDKENALADQCCMILNNMTCLLHLMDRVVTLVEKSNYTWEDIVAVFTVTKYNKAGANLHYLAYVINNVSRSPRVRSYLMDKDRTIIQRLLPFMDYKDNLVKRGIIGTVKNCCFDTHSHEWLLSPEVDILSYLLLPLAGPEEFDDEDNDKLPICLQYLPETKEREADPEIRLTLLETLFQLCATKGGRQILREKNTYVILREYHKWEQDKRVLLACENIVDILIRTEEEIGLDNLKEVAVPSEYIEKFHKMDQEFISD